jgi:hypothetical protein
MEALLTHLTSNKLPHRVQLGPNNRVQHLFITLPECLEHLQSNYDVILIDNTYRTNRFNLPLMDIIGRLLSIVYIASLTHKLL